SHSDKISGGETAHETRQVERRRQGSVPECEAAETKPERLEQQSGRPRQKEDQGQPRGETRHLNGVRKIERRVFAERIVRRSCFFAAGHTQLLFHLFAGDVGSRLNALQLEAELVRIRRATQRLIQRDQAVLVQNVQRLVE